MGRWMAILLMASVLAGCAAPTSAPTAVPPTSTATPLPTLAPLPTTAPTLPAASPTPMPATATPAASPTVTVTAPPAATLSPTPPLTHQAGFVADVTVPDGALLKPGQIFVKTWRLANVGTAVWTPDYRLVFVKGAVLTETTEIALPAAVAPGETIDIALTLQAPAEPGRYQSFWQLRTSAGELFGVGAGFNEPIYLDIVVTPLAGGVAGPPIAIQGVTLRAPAAAVTAPCPYVLELAGTLDVSGVGEVAYELEAAVTTPGFQYQAPPLTQAYFVGAEPNPFPIAYTLTLSGSVAARFQVHILRPAELRSAPVDFSLTCAP